MMRMPTSRFHHSSFPARRWLLRSRCIIPGPLFGRWLLSRWLITFRHQIITLLFFFRTFFLFALGIQSVIFLQSFDNMCTHYSLLLNVSLNQSLGLYSVQMRLILEFIIANRLRHCFLHQLQIIMILAHGWKLALVYLLFSSLGSSAGLKVTCEIPFPLLKHSFGNFSLCNIFINKFHFFSDSLSIG